MPPAQRRNAAGHGGASGAVTRCVSMAAETRRAAFLFRAEPLLHSFPPVSPSLPVQIWLPSQAVSRVVSVAVAVWPGRALVAARGPGKDLPLRLARSM